MTDPEIRYQTLLKKLHNRGSRFTSHRLAILRLLAVSEDHPSAFHLYEKLKTQFPTISLATVYKTIALLKEEGELLEIDFHNDSRYDGNKPYPHPHLICEQCGRIWDGDEVQSTDILHQEIQNRFMFQVTRAQMNFFGICQTCQQRN